MKRELRIELSDPKPGSVFQITYYPITLDAFPHYLAYSALAIIAATLDSFEKPDGARHHWTPDGVGASLNVASFVAWLPMNTRASFFGSAMHWERPAGAALRAVVAGQKAG